MRKIKKFRFIGTFTENAVSVRNLKKNATFLLFDHDF